MDRSIRPDRTLSIADLGIELPEMQTAASESKPAYSAIAALATGHPVLELVQQLMKDGYAGVIFRGPPGTGKSWLAARVAYTLADSDSSRYRFVQFHPSYQYEDFVEGYRPQDDGKFALEPSNFLLLCKDAALNPSKEHVLVIDEISRTDAARVFGECLTYIERTKRGIPFQLASGNEAVVPQNLFLIATMNPWDRGVEEVDVALERRFAVVDILPSTDELRAILSGNGMADDLSEKLVAFFDRIQKSPNEQCRIGHAYFVTAFDIQSVQRLWLYFLLPYFSKACRFDPDELERIRSAWKAVLADPAHAAPNADLAGDTAAA